MLGVKSLQVRPIKGGTGNRQILQTGLQEVCNHFILACVGLQKFGVFFIIFDDSVTVFGKAEEVAFLLQKLYGSRSAVGAFVRPSSCGFRKEGFAGRAVPAS